MFLADNRDELLRDVQNASMANIGCNVVTRKDALSHHDFQTKRFGKYRYVI